MRRILNMQKKDFLLHLDNLLELDAGTLKGDEAVSELASWDSLAVLGFLALVDKEFKVVLSPADINKAKIVNDLVMLLGNKIQ